MAKVVQNIAVIAYLKIEYDTDEGHWDDIADDVVSDMDYEFDYYHPTNATKIVHSEIVSWERINQDVHSDVEVIRIDSSKGVKTNTGGLS